MKIKGKLSDNLFEEKWEEIFRVAIRQDALPVMPRQKVIYPYESWHEEVSNPLLLKILLEAYQNGRYIGMLYSPKGDGFLPPVGNNGTIAAFGLKRLNKKKYLAKFMGLPRFTATEYLIKGTIYPVAQIELFEDDEEDAAEIRKGVERVVELMLETDRIRGDTNDRKGWLEMSKKPGGVDALTYGNLKYWSGNHETRYHMLSLRSGVKRLEYLAAVIFSYNRKEAVAEALRKNN